MEETSRGTELDSFRANASSSFGLYDTDADGTNINGTSQHPLIQVDKKMYICLGALIILIGTVGNMLSLILWICSSLRKHPLASYMTVLAISDMLTLYSRLFPEIIGMETNLFLGDVNAALCYVRFFLTYTSGHMTAWLLTFMSINKAIAVCIPFKAKRFITCKSGWMVVGVITVAIIGLNMHIFWTFSFDPLKEEIRCGGSDFVYDIWPWIDLAFGVLVPFALLILTNIVIIYKIVGANRRRLGLTTVKKNDNDLTSVSAILIALSLAFLVLNLPTILFVLLFNDELLVGMQQFEVNFFQSFAFLLQYLNSSINFFLYCLTWPTFREKLRLMFCKRNDHDKRSLCTKSDSNGLVQKKHCVTQIDASPDKEKVHTDQKKKHCDHSKVDLEFCSYM